MAVTGLQEVVVDCHEPARLAGFWADVFGTDPTIRGDDWAYIESPATRTRIAFQKVPEPKTIKNRVHLDVEVDDIPTETERVVALGATAIGHIVVDDQGPFQVMRDPEGNEFCVA